MADWYVGQGGQQRGPLSDEALRGMLARGEISPADLVWRDGMAQWTPAGQVAELAPPAPAPAPPPAAPAYAAPAPPPPAAPAYAAPAPAPDTSAWYIGRGGQQLGPYSTADVQRMGASGQVFPGDLLWKQGMAQWLPLASIPELAARPGPGMPGMQPYPGYGYMPTGPSPFGVMMGHVGGIFKNPEEGLKTAADAKVPLLSFITIGLACLLTGLFSLQRACAFRAGSAEAFFKPFLFDLLNYGIAFGALMLVLAAILQKPNSWAKAFSVLGLGALPLVAMGFVAFLFGWIDLWFVNLYQAVTPASVIVAYFVFVHVSQAGHRFALITMPTIYFALYLINCGIQAAMRGGGGGGGGGVADALRQLGL